MKLVPASEFDVDMWAAAYAAAYNPEISPLMGYDSAGMGIAPPSFLDFYDSWQTRQEAGDLYAWGVLDRDDKFVGYTVLNRTKELPEWETGTAISDVSSRNKGLGVRAHILTLKFAFEELDATWVWAVSEVRSPTVEKIMERGGYTRFAHFYLMRRDDWFNGRWHGRL